MIMCCMLYIDTVVTSPALSLGDTLTTAEEEEDITIGSRGSLMPEDTGGTPGATAMGTGELAQNSGEILFSVGNVLHFTETNVRTITKIIVIIALTDTRVHITTGNEKGAFIITRKKKANVLSALIIDILQPARFIVFSENN